MSATRSSSISALLNHGCRSLWMPGTQVKTFPAAPGSSPFSRENLSNECMIYTVADVQDALRSPPLLSQCKVCVWLLCVAALISLRTVLWGPTVKKYVWVPSWQRLDLWLLVLSANLIGLRNAWETWKVNLWVYLWLDFQRQSDNKGSDLRDGLNPWWIPSTVALPRSRRG